MNDLWQSLEEQTAAWNALDRQQLADAIWSNYVSVRFGGTGDGRALRFLYPYLNRGEREVRLRAIDVAGRVMKGRGPRAVEELDYFTRNPNLFLRDRAVIVVGAAVTGWPSGVILDTLRPYLNHRNRFIRQQTVTALSRSAFASGSDEVLAEIRRVAPGADVGQVELRLAAARVFSGRPNEPVWRLVAALDAPVEWWGSDEAVGILLQEAGDEWYQRGCREYFDPRLQADPKRDPWPFDAFERRYPQFLHRGALGGLCRAARGRGMDPLGRMLHLRHNACTVHAMMGGAPRCFERADRPVNLPPLLELLKSGDIPAQRIAAVCLGRLMDATEDAHCVQRLTDLARSAGEVVASAAIVGAGCVARGTCDESLRALCLDLARREPTARAAVEALGLVFQCSGRKEVLADLRELAEAYRSRPAKSRHQYRPLTECYLSAGRVYMGTGSMEPVDFLLDVLAARPIIKWCNYRWAAGRALVMTEFPAHTFERALEQPWV
jgi:hypothetical protein